MTEGTALDFAKSKMNELGVEDYRLRYRHIIFKGREKKILKGENQLFIFIQSYGQVKITSKAGIYDRTDAAINEMQYIHTGLIEIENNSTRQTEVRMIQVIPTYKNT